MSRSLELFPKTIRSIDELSGPVAEVIRRHQSVDSIRQMIAIPPGAYPVRRTVRGVELPFGWRKTPARTLVFGEHTLTVIEVERGLVSTAASIPLAALIDVHLFQVLLYSWIELMWEDQNEVKAIKVEYNSVGNALIRRGLTQIRETFPRRIVHHPDSQPDIDLTDFPFKFKSYLHSSLRSEEHLVAAVYQPAIRPSARRWSWFISPNRAVVVTDRSFIVLEDQRNRWRRGNKVDADYAISRHFYPLDRLQSALLVSGLDADQLRLGFGTRSVIYDIAIPLMPPRAQQLCDLLRDHALIP
jgi:hypothetical protein